MRNVLFKQCIRICSYAFGIQCPYHRFEVGGYESSNTLDVVPSFKTIVAKYEGSKMAFAQKNVVGFEGSEKEKDEEDDKIGRFSLAKGYKLYSPTLTPKRGGRRH
ncbi:hypothetical protein CEXT_539441 [Caerostris extrusa]|uniref:Uncharacterized protein n=1 Tax=Caerostris extrusa TaxID=172846 RepID=A0AAV4RPI6_CAEEX|nr:hypothetical protein CEXT_539441 [Caerostris extrusa]